MAKTPSGGSDPYCTAAEFFAYFDDRFAGQSVKDDGTILTAADLEDDANLLAALKAASGELEAACLIGERYQPEDLIRLLEEDNNSAALLREIVAVLALYKVARRRGISYEAFKPDLDAAREALDQLRAGDRIFAFAETQAANLPDNSVYTDRDRRELNLVSREAVRFFGVRQADRRYRGGG